MDAPTPHQRKHPRDLNQLAARIVDAATDDDTIRCPACQSEEITQGEITIQQPHPTQLWVGGPSTKQVTIACTCRACGERFDEKRWAPSSYNPDAPA